MDKSAIRVERFVSIGDSPRLRVIWVLSGVEEFMELAVLQPSDIADLDLSAAWRWIRFPQRKSETEMKEAICVDVPRVPVAHVQGVEGQPWVLGDRMKWAIASNIREWRNGDAEASWYSGLHSTMHTFLWYEVQSII